jgi:cobalt-zinc-cadmium efflux system membrane fusion protein
VLVVFTAGGAAAWLASGKSTPPGGHKSEKTDAEPAPKISRGGPDEVIVPPAVQASLGLKTAPAAIPTRKRTLPAFQGKLNFDDTRLVRVQSPLPGPIIEIREVPDTVTTALPTSPPPKATRPIKFGDYANKGDVLAVVWSKDLGEKKSEFVDAVSKLRTDEETLKRLEKLYQDNGTAERTLREQERTVKGDRIAVERAEATLRAWRIPDADIEALRAAADQVGTGDAAATRTNPAKWARLEIKAPISGTVLERNFGVGQVVDTTVDLFRIGEMSTMAVWVNIFEEDLPLLRTLTLPTPWTVSAAAVPGSAFPGRLEQTAASIDTIQHTALVYGTVQNPRGELKAGMAVTVTVELDPPKGEIEVPAESVIEDGRESYLFVRPDPNSDKFVRRPVAVLRRARDVISVAERADGPKPGDLVVTSGSLLLGDAVSELPQPKP